MDLLIHLAIFFRIALSTWQGILQLPCFYFLIAFLEIHMTAQEAFPFASKVANPNAVVPVPRCHNRDFILYVEDQ